MGLKMGNYLMLAFGILFVITCGGLFIADLSIQHENTNIDQSFIASLADFDQLQNDSLELREQVASGEIPGFWTVIFDAVGTVFGLVSASVFMITTGLINLASTFGIPLILMEIIIMMLVTVIGILAIEVVTKWELFK